MNFSQLKKKVQNMKNLFNIFFTTDVICLVLIQNYLKLIFQTFVSLFVFFLYEVGNGEINGCGACKNILKSGGAKNLYTQG